MRRSVGASVRSPSDSDESDVESGGADESAVETCSSADASVRSPSDSDESDAESGCLDGVTDNGGLASISAKRSSAIALNSRSVAVASVSSRCIGVGVVSRGIDEGSAESCCIDGREPKLHVVGGSVAGPYCTNRSDVSSRCVGISSCIVACVVSCRIGGADVDPPCDCRSCCIGRIGDERLFRIDLHVASRGGCDVSGRRGSGLHGIEASGRDCVVSHGSTPAVASTQEGENWGSTSILSFPSPEVCPVGDASASVHSCSSDVGTGAGTGSCGTRSRGSPNGGVESGRAIGLGSGRLDDGHGWNCTSVSGSFGVSRSRAGTAAAISGNADSPSVRGCNNSRASGT